MDSTALSLDDIIKKKKLTSGTGFRGKKPLTTNKKPRPGGIVQKFTSPKKRIGKKPVLDARNKIIQKNRAKIHDARDKLAQIAKRSGDARLKLLKKNITTLKKYGELGPAVASVKRATAAVAGPLKLPKRSIQSNAPKRTMYSARVPSNANDDIDMDVDMDYFPTSVNLRRTVKNEIAYSAPASSMPPLPTFKYIDPQPRRMTAPTRANDEWESDPFDCYEVPVARPYDVSEPRNLNRSVREAHMDAYPRKGILRSSSSNGGGVASIGSSALHSYERSAPYISSGNSDLLARKRYPMDENSHLSHEMRVRLQRTPDVTQSMGIFSNPYAPSSRESRQVTNAGYRIVVSNLHSSVSQSDIKELFEDVGPLLDARLVRTGVAEVIFEKLKDAETAVDTYHNRQLDGQPMKCLLVNPRASNRPTAPAIKPTRSSNVNKSSKVEIDIDALHSVLFRRS